MKIVNYHLKFNIPSNPGDLKFSLPSLTLDTIIIVKFSGIYLPMRLGKLSHNFFTKYRTNFTQNATVLSHSFSTKCTRYGAKLSILIII